MMSSEKEPVRIAVADSDSDMLDFYRGCITQPGQRIFAMSSAAELLDDFPRLQPDVVVTEAEFPESDGLKTVRKLFAMQPTTVIVVTGNDSADLIQRVQSAPVMGCLLKPVNQRQLLTSLAICRRRFSELIAFRNEAETLRETIEARKIIAQAKGVLMKESNYDEDGAFHHLQSIARNQNMKMADVAKIILAHQAAKQAVT